MTITHLSRDDVYRLLEYYADALGMDLGECMELYHECPSCPCQLTQTIAGTEIVSMLFLIGLH